MNPDLAIRIFLCDSVLSRTNKNAKHLLLHYRVSMSLQLPQSGVGSGSSSRFGGGGGLPQQAAAHIFIKKALTRG